ncbi:MAG: efflux RND transporter permease subunit [Candidatus Aminicenantes bacterium]|nr:MAG: efflux RND transporter permease subunit [Candidatus Aminicenantes bacterium]
MRISRKAVDKPVLVALITILLVLLGIIGLQTLPLEEYPQIDVPWVVVAIPYPGAAAEDIEQKVTVKVDEKLNGIKHLKRLYSEATEGVSVHVMELYEKTDKKETLQDVKDKIDQVKRDLPDDVEEPIIEDIAFDNVPIILVNVTGEVELLILKEIAKDIKTDIEAIPGVREVAFYGGLEKEVQVQLDPRKTERYGLSYSMIIAALRQQNANLPGGYLRLNSFEYLVRTEGKFKDVHDIGTTVVGVKSGHPIFLRDVAEIKDTHKKIDSYSRYNGKPSVSLVVYKQSEINTMKTTGLIKQIAADYDTRMPETVQVTTTMDKGDDISLMVRQLSSNALYGLLFVLLTLMIFMGLRNAIIVAIAIPFSLLVGFFLMWIFGFTLNMITIFATILIIGLVVDGAMIVGENIYHHFEKGLNTIEASKEGISEVGTAVISADLTTISAFFPMIFIAGIMGQIMSFMPYVVIFALIGSIIIDHLTLPMIASKYMRLSKQGRERKRFTRVFFIGNRLFRFLIRFYKPLLRWALYHRKTVVLISTLAFFMALLLFGSGAIKVDFFPKEEMGRFNINFELPVGSTVDKTNRVALQIEESIAQIPEVKEYVSTIGDTGMVMADLQESADTGGSGPEFGKILINIGYDNERKRSQAEIIEEVDSKLAEIPGIKYSFWELEMGPPVGRPVAVQISGEDFEELKNLSLVVEENLNSIPGTKNVQNSFQKNKPQVSIKVDRTQAAKHGISAQEITLQVMAAFLGYEATEIMIGDELVDIRVINNEAYRRNFEHVLDTPVFSTTGMKIPLRQLAQVEINEGIYSIQRQNLRRSVTVGCDVEEGFTPQEIFASLQKLMESSPPPQGYTLEYGGEEEERQRSFESMTRVMFLGLILIFFVLTAQFDSFKQPLVILFTVPLSIIGVVTGLFITRLTFSFMAFVGVVALVGIVVNDGIVLVDFINQRRRSGVDLISAILEAGPRRLRPVILTTVTTIGGLLPITLNLGGGGKLWAPLGTSIIFGLLFATILTLVIVPSVYSIFERKAYKEALAHHKNVGA